MKFKTETGFNCPVLTIKINEMYNRKFDIHRDFHELNELENRIMPIVRKIEDEDEKDVLTLYIREIFNNQWKK